MVRLTLYGGIREIGGNKALLEDGDKKLFLDFGFSYKRHKLFYEEYLKPRGGAGLLDLLVMGLIPLLEGVYRDDLCLPDLWKRFRNKPLYRPLDGVSGVLLSHAHLDHSGHISLLRGDITVYATAATAFIAKSMQDSGKADFDQQVCYFSPKKQACPAGWRQVACLGGSSMKQQRQFCIGDKKPEDLSTDAIHFWSSGFWDKASKQKELVTLPLQAHIDSEPGLRCFPVDHSIPGACAWGIETSSGWVIYTGDLRLHGKRADLTRKFMSEAASLRPRALIMEGTNVLRKTNIAEQEVYQNGLKVIAGAKKLVFADFSPRDVDRLLTFLQIARDTRRRLVILPKDAYLLKTLRLLEPQIPDIAQDNNLAIYQETTARKSPEYWQCNLFQEYSHKTVLAEDVASAQDQFILCFSFFDLNELPSLCPEPGSLYVYSCSEPHDEEQEIDFYRLHQWLKYFGIKGFGVHVKKGDKWQVPDGEEGLHASGHACGSDLLAIAREIESEVLIPIHSESPEFFLEHLENSGIKVILPEPGEAIEI